MTRVSDSLLDEGEGCSDGQSAVQRVNDDFRQAFDGAHRIEFGGSDETPEELFESHGDDGLQGSVNGRGGGIGMRDAALG